MSPDSKPLVLVDEPDDCRAEELGWVDGRVSEDRARDLLAPFVYDEDGRSGCRPNGPARRVLLAHDYDVDRWVPVEAGTPGAREFWEFSVWDADPAPAATPEGGGTDAA